MTEQDAIREARRRVKLKRDFLQKLYAWIPISFFLIVINFLTGSDHWWAFYPIAALGLSLAIKAAKLYGTSADWEQQEMEKELRRRGYEQKKGQLEEPMNMEGGLELKPPKEIQKNWRDNDLV